MYHSFDIYYAEKYGLSEAIIINSLQHFIVQGIANNKNFYDGRTWALLIVPSSQKIWPYWSKKQIKRICESLVNQGVLILGEKSKPEINRFWYAFADEKEFLLDLNKHE